MNVGAIHWLLSNAVAFGMPSEAEWLIVVPVALLFPMWIAYSVGKRVGRGEAAQQELEERRKRDRS